MGSDRHGGVYRRCSEEYRHDTDKDKGGERRPGSAAEGIKNSHRQPVKMEYFQTEVKNLEGDCIMYRSSEE